MFFNPKCTSSISEIIKKLARAEFQFLEVLFLLWPKIGLGLAFYKRKKAVFAPKPSSSSSVFSASSSKFGIVVLGD